MPSKRVTIAIKERDVLILRALFESRIMTLDHISGLCFKGREPSAKKRVQKLKKANYIGERARLVNEPAIHYLTTKGHLLLHDIGILKEYPTVSKSSFIQRVQVKTSTLRHELEVMDVKTAFCGALLNSEEFEVTEFSTWPALYRFTAQSPGLGFNGSSERNINPDGYIKVNRKDGTGGFSFFIEIDRSTEKQEILAMKAACYVDFYKSGGFAARHGAPRSDFAAFPFRILFVCMNTERRNNAAAKMLTFPTPIYRQAWLTTLPEVLASPLGKIWTCPSDFEEATKGTEYNPYTQRDTKTYARQKEREVFVEERIIKHRLF